MNAKRTRMSGTRRPNEGKKPASKKPTTRKIKIDQSVARASLGDDYWQIDITISNEDRIRVASIIIRQPTPPPPPFTDGHLINWVRSALG
jgi:hypothetical protein